jgi:hypothetical protein
MLGSGLAWGAAAPAGWRCAVTPRVLGVGFNPFRQQQRRTSDYVLVAAAVAITLALVLWALIPR